jgi:hypothetical protein
MLPSHLHLWPEEMGEELMRVLHSTRHTAAALLLSTATCLATAQGGPIDATQGFWLQATAFGASLDSSFSVSSGFNDFRGTTLALESDYGLPSRRAVPSLALGMRLGTRWRLEGELLGINRSGSAITLARDLVFDDYTYPTKTTVRARLDCQALRVGGGFAFISTDSAEVGVSAAFLGSTVKTRVELAGTSVGGGTILPEVTRTNSTLIPMVGLYGRNSLGTDWGLAWRAEGGRDIGGGSTDSNATNLMFTALWRATPQLAVHFGVRHFVANIESRDDLFSVLGGNGTFYSRTRAKISMTGPLVGMTLSF